MLRWIWKTVKRILLGILILILLLLAPVGYVEFGCRENAANAPYTPIISAPEFQRNEAATFLTYPEWHIVHAYDNYAKVIQTGNPHDFKFLKSIFGFWSSACTLTRMADTYGGAEKHLRNVIYVIGVSFTAELAMKALYEETVGRVFVNLRGKDHSTLDKVSAEMAAEYATFLQQIPWYKYDFPKDRADLAKRMDGSLRDRERKFALGTEFAVKTAYAKVIAQAVAATETAKLQIRTVVTGLDETALSRIPDVIIIGKIGDKIIIETPRYRAFTHILQEIAALGGEIVEIAGNDDIMMSLISKTQQSDLKGIALYRQGYNDFRYLYWVPLKDLATLIRKFDADQDIQLEHIYDY